MPSRNWSLINDYSEEGVEVRRSALRNMLFGMYDLTLRQQELELFHRKWFIYETGLTGAVNSQLI